MEVEASIFPTLSEVMTSIDPAHKYWVVVDLKSCNQQIKSLPRMSTNLGSSSSLDSMFIDANLSVSSTADLLCNISNKPAGGYRDEDRSG